MSEGDAGATVHSGQDCPCSGVWQAKGAVLPPLLVAKGSIMPAVAGRVVLWTLLAGRGEPQGGQGNP
jgi:hypothetical protein